LLTTTLPKKGRNVGHVARVVYLMPGDIIITTGTLRYSWMHGIYRRMPGDEPKKWNIPLTPSNIDSARSVLCFRYGKTPPAREEEFQKMLLKWDLIKEKPKPNTVVAPPVKAKAKPLVKAKGPKNSEVHDLTQKTTDEDPVMSSRLWMNTKILSVHKQVTVLEFLERRDDHKLRFRAGMIFSMVVPNAVTTKGAPKLPTPPCSASGSGCTRWCASRAAGLATSSVWWSSNNLVLTGLGRACSKSMPPRCLPTHRATPSRQPRSSRRQVSCWPTPRSTTRAPRWP